MLQHGSILFKELPYSAVQGGNPKPHLKASSKEDVGKREEADPPLNPLTSLTFPPAQLPPSI